MMFGQNYDMISCDRISRLPVAFGCKRGCIFEICCSCYVYDAIFCWLVLRTLMFIVDTKGATLTRWLMRLVISYKRMEWSLSLTWPRLTTCREISLVRQCSLNDYSLPNVPVSARTKHNTPTDMNRLTSCPQLTCIHRITFLIFLHEEATATHLYSSCLTGKKTVSFDVLSVNGHHGCIIRLCVLLGVFLVSSVHLPA